MATGPEHYREAERLLQEAKPAPGVSPEAQLASIPMILAKAQVHATLALVAARLPLPRDHRAWADVLNGEPG